MKQRYLFNMVTTAAITFILAGAIAASATDVAKHDVNGDGVVSMSDATLLNRYVAEDVTIDVELYTYDINGDGLLDTSDTLEVLLFLVEQEKESETTETTTSTTTTTTTTTTETTNTTTSATTTTTTPTETTTTTTAQTVWQNPTREDIINYYTNDPIDEEEYNYFVEFISQYNVPYWNIVHVVETPTIELNGMVQTWFWSIDGVEYSDMWYMASAEEVQPLYTNIEEEDINFSWDDAEFMVYLLQPYRGDSGNCYVSDDGKWIMQPIGDGYDTDMKYNIILLDETGTPLEDQNIFNYPLSS